MIGCQSHSRGALLRILPYHPAEDARGANIGLPREASPACIVLSAIFVTWQRSVAAGRQVEIHPPCVDTGQTATASTRRD